MRSTFLGVGVFALALTLCAAQTPPNFTPATSNPLTVIYGGNSSVTPAGITVPVTEVAEVPTLIFPSASSGTYVVIMLDLSVEPKNDPAGTNTTLLHWVLPGLSSAQDSPTPDLTSSDDPPAPYFPPGPPAGQTHTYALFLYNQPADFTIPDKYVPFFNNLTASVFNRVGFNLSEFVDTAGLGSPVAADWYLVSNTTTSASSNATSSPGASATASSTSATASSTSSTASSTSAAPAMFTGSASVFGIAGSAVLVALGTAAGMLLGL